MRKTNGSQQNPAAESHSRMAGRREISNKGGVDIQLPRTVGIIAAALFIVLTVIGIPLAGWLIDRGFPRLSVSSYNFFGVLFSFFAVVLAVFSVIALRKKRAVSRWAPVVATVIESAQEPGPFNKMPLFTYEYVAGAKVYRSRRIIFYNTRRGSAPNLIKRYPVGSQLQAFYDPAQPAEAVINRNFPAVRLAPLFALVFALLAAAFFKLPDFLLAR